MLKTASSLINSLFYAGTWDASSNTPTLTSGVGVKNTVEALAALPSVQWAADPDQPITPTGAKV
jgi:hypothetical protein